MCSAEKRRGKRSIGRPGTCVLFCYTLKRVYFSFAKRARAFCASYKQADRDVGPFRFRREGDPAPKAGSVSGFLATSARGRFLEMSSSEPWILIRLIYCNAHVGVRHFIWFYFVSLHVERNQTEPNSKTSEKNQTSIWSGLCNRTDRCESELGRTRSTFHNV